MKSIKDNKPALSRDFSLDLSRAIGTLLIILAHVGAPNVVNEIRCFDVVLLVFVSGYCINYVDYGKYLWKRFKRLVIPAWILLVVLFSATWVACFIVNKEQIYSATTILKSFFFLNGGIGFIWIVRIYMGVAILTPVLVWINKFIKSNSAFLAFSFAFILMNSFVARKYCTENASIIYYMIEILAYSSVALIGYRYKQMGKTNWQNTPRYILSLLAITTVGNIVTICLFGFQPNENKYPPVEPYLFYGMFVTALIFLAINGLNIQINAKLENSICKFSILSYDTYLIHIFVLSVFDLLEEMIKDPIDWRIKYLAVLVLSFLGALVFDKIRLLLKKKCVSVSR